MARRTQPRRRDIAPLGFAASLGPGIVLSDNSVAEDTTIGALVGNLSVTGGSGTYAFTLTNDAGGLFAIDAVDDTRLEVAAALDYETATSHVIQITADNGVDTPIVRNKTVFVTNVLDLFFPDNATGASEYQLLFAA